MGILRNYNFCIILILVSFLCAGCSMLEKYEGPPADFVIKNAKIVTIDKENPRAEAIAVIGEKIIAVTTNRAIEQYIEEGKTEVVDAKGRLVIPGFNDAHLHFRGSALTNLDFRYISDVKIIQGMVLDAVEHVKPGEVIRGRAWDHEEFPDKQWPTKELLDVVAPNNPVVLSRVDGHSVWVNSYVLRESRITKNTQPPPGGEIIRDPATGEPTGILKEAALSLIRIKETTLTPEEREKRDVYEMELALKHAAKLGVTSIQHLNYSHDILQKFLDEGKLTTRVTFNGRLPSDEAGLIREKELLDRFPQSNNWLRYGYLKSFIDGTLGSATALMFEPFADEPDKTGLPQMEYAELERRVVSADAMGFQIGIHAIGTKGNNWILNAYEKAQIVNGIRDSRHRSEHAQILTLEDIPRFGELGVIASMQPTHCISDKRFAEKRLGLERCIGAYAWNKLLDAGAHVAFGTDFPVEPLDPLEGLYSAVTRKDRAGEEGPGWFPDQILSMEKAIELYTLEAAFAEFMEDRKGMLKVGYLADMVIYSNDLFDIPADEIMENLVDYTVTGGKIVYEREGAN